jgi:hypothetical protein
MDRTRNWEKVEDMVDKKYYAYKKIEKELSLQTMVKRLNYMGIYVTEINSVIVWTKRVVKGTREVVLEVSIHLPHYMIHYERQYIVYPDTLNEVEREEAWIQPSVSCNCG